MLYNSDERDPFFTFLSMYALGFARKWYLILARGLNYHKNSGMVTFKILRSVRRNHIRNISILPIADENMDFYTKPFRHYYVHHPEQA